MVPEGWYSTKLGKVFKSRRERGYDGLPTISVTLNNGLVLRESLDRKTDTTLSPEEHLLVRTGDIAYNMMRMWQGASGLARFDALVSPAYVVLKPTKDIDPVFASYLFKSARMIHLLWAYSYGLTKDRLRLYFPDFSLIPAVLPPIEEQRRIGALLSRWDRAIEILDNLIANSEALKKALTQKLVSGATRLPEFADRPWNPHAFGKLATISKKRYDPKTDKTSKRCVELEHLESASGRLLGYCDAHGQDSLKAAFEPDDVLFGKLRPYLRKFYLADFSGVCSTEIWVFKTNRSLCEPAFLACLVQTDSFQRAANISSGSKMPRADWEVLKDAIFHLPPKEEQLAIVTVTSRSDQLVRRYRVARENLAAEKFAIIEELVTGRRRVRCIEPKEVARA
ncbi:MAG: restriction endonuclease subunit S [Candidatus Acidiferrales bacterium]